MALAAANLPSITPLQLVSGGQIPVIVRRSQRATRIAIRLRVAEASIELILPETASMAMGLRFIESRRAWAAARIALLPATVPFAPGSLIPVLGIPRRLDSVGRGTGVVTPFRVTPTTIEVTGDLGFIGRRTRQGLVTLAREMLLRKSEALAAKIGKTIGRVSVGDARTRWGSCTATRDLRYSWRLVMAPESVLDYVVAHEVAHLEQMNHSVAFWTGVAALHSSYAEDRAWLKRHGNDLFRYGF